MEKSTVFKTDRRIRLGILGLGRGANFIKLCATLQIDVVAGCDINPVMRQRFQQECPDAFLTDDMEVFLTYDMDAVLIASWFGKHAEHAIMALRHGKHVLCEVTSFFTPAEGVALYEAVQQSGKVYNLMENYPFTKANFTLKRLWDEGLFGELMYAEYNYVHECKSLAYTYINGVPIQPGNTVHNWRSWLNMHYYNTHSLGPIMFVSGTRPVRITAPPGHGIHIPGAFGGSAAKGVAVSLIEMDNGGIVRNLMGPMPHDNNRQLVYGTQAYSENYGDTLQLRIGKSGAGRELDVVAQWPTLGELAESGGHSGGDFWELYFFARQVLTGEKAPWEIERACDMTLAGIMAYKSQSLGGCPVDIPDFRRAVDRELFRNDHFAQKRPFDPERVFPEDCDPKLTGNFTTVMSKLGSFHDHETGVNLVNNALTGLRLYNELANDRDRLNVIRDVQKLLVQLPELRKVYAEALQIADSCPDSLPGRMIHELLDNSFRNEIMRMEDTAEQLRRFLCACAAPAGK